MSRTLKFRAKTLSGDIIYFDLYQVTAGYYPDGVFYAKGEPIKMGSEQEYTGSKDKNGKEIYEGDILNWTVYGVVTWENGGFIAITPLGSHYHIHKESSKEVIGNIYENPELLKGR